MEKAMLHILLLILKWIGILLLAILLLALLVICLALFVPIRYKADLSCQNSVETLEANLEIFWMWRLFFLMVSWKEGKANLKMRIVWKDFFSGERKADDANPEESDEEEQKEEHPNAEMCRTEGVIREQETQETGRKLEEKRKVSSFGKYPSSKKRKKSLWQRMQAKVLAWIDGFRAFWEKLLATGRNIRGKKEQAEQFLHDASHQRAFRKLAKEMGMFFRDISPENIKIVGKIGLEDPAMTGQLLAVLGVLFPFLGEHTVIVPDFEHPVLEGSAHIEGNIQNVRMVMIVWRLFTDRDVRKIIIDIKKLKW